jgi:hypothetical protein
MEKPELSACRGDGSNLWKAETQDRESAKGRKREMEAGWINRGSAFHSLFLFRAFVLSRFRDPAFRT